MAPLPSAAHHTVDEARSEPLDQSDCIWGKPIEPALHNPACPLRPLSLRGFIFPVENRSETLCRGRPVRGAEVYTIGRPSPSHLFRFCAFLLVDVTSRLPR